MSVAYRLNNPVAPAPELVTPAAGYKRHAEPIEAHRLATEAPDAGDRRATEAPDAGETRFEPISAIFSHGRSQS